MKKALLLTGISLVVSTLVAQISDNNTIHIKNGWQLKGALSDINASLFNLQNVISVWTYEDGKWKVYLPNNSSLMDNLPNGIDKLQMINKEEGYWVFANADFSIYYNSDQNGSEGNDNNSSGDNNSTGGGNSNFGNDNNSSGDNNSTSGGNIDYCGFRLSLINTPTDFTLSDVQGRTFTNYNIKNNDTYPTVTFDNQGVATVNIDDKTYTLKYENGSINIYNDNNAKISSLKKIASDENGLIATDLLHENSRYEPVDIDIWVSGSLNPENMQSYLPLTVYTDWASKMVYDTNGTLTRYNYENNITGSNNFTVDGDGALVETIKYHWSNDTNTTTYYENYTFGLQKVGSIGGYDIAKTTMGGLYWYIDQNLTNKTWRDLIGTDYKIGYGFSLNSDGSINFYDSSEENATYTLNSDTNMTINHVYCYTDDQNNSKCDNWKEFFVLDSSDGNVSDIMNDKSSYKIYRTDHHFVKKVYISCQNGRIIYDKPEKTPFYRKIFNLFR